MASLPNSRTVTYEEWLRMPEVSGLREEVVNGEIRIMPPPKLKHGLIVRRLCKAFDSQTDDRQVLVLDVDFGLVTRREPLTTRVPDLAVFEWSTVVERDGYIHSAPQLAVEALSPSNTRRERDEKLADYATLGIPEVWIIAPEGRTVEVLYLENGQFRGHAVLTDGILTPKHFPGVEVRISEIWPD
jgi:Uma2 family endonuclease